MHNLYGFECAFKVIQGQRHETQSKVSLGQLLWQFMHNNISTLHGASRGFSETAEFINLLKVYTERNVYYYCVCVWRQVLTREQMKKKSEKLYKSKQRVPVA